MTSVRDMIPIEQRPHVIPTVVPRDSFEKHRWQSGLYTFRKEKKEKEASFMNLIVKKSKHTVGPSHYKRPDLDLFSAKPHFSLSKAAKVSYLGEVAKQKQFVPGMIYDLSDKMHRTIGTINL